MGKEETKQALVYANKSRKKKLILAIGIGVILLIILISLIAKFV